MEHYRECEITHLERSVHTRAVKLMHSVQSEKIMHITDNEHNVPQYNYVELDDCVITKL